MLRMDSKPTHFSSLAVGALEEERSSTGGRVIRFKANATTLLVGDPVFFSAADTVDKSGTTANYIRFAGIVVGGNGTRYQVAHDTSMVGMTAALAGEDVLVQIDGIAWVVANIAVAITDNVIVSTTAGKVTPGTTANQIIGTPVTTAAVLNDKFKLLIDHR